MEPLRGKDGFRRQLMVVDTAGAGFGRGGGMAGIGALGGTSTISHPWPGGADGPGSFPWQRERQPAAARCGDPPPPGDSFEVNPLAFSHSSFAWMPGKLAMVLTAPPPEEGA